MGKSILELSNYVNLIVSVVIERDGKILMVEEAKKGIEGLFNFPSGKVKENETLFEAVKRETLEETGYEIEIIDLCSVYHYGWDDNKGISIRFNFWGNIIQEKTKVLANDVKSATFFDKKDLENIIKEKKYRFGGTALMIRDVLNNQKSGLKSIITTNNSIEKIWENENR